MKGFILVFSLNSGAQGHSRDAWFGPDKVKHFFTSAFVQSIAYGGLRRAGLESRGALTGASLSTAALGVGKELRDLSTHGEFSVRDLVWDAAGAGTASVLLVRTVR